MKKVLCAMIAAALLLAGCGSTSKSSEGSSLASASAPATEKKLTKIGIIQLVEHPALDDANKGFIDGLKELGYIDGENITIDFNSAQGEAPNCVTIANKLVSTNTDLILAIATPAAQAAANATKDIPILVTAVTDPETARLVASNKAPGGNVTGTSDLSPVKEQFQLIKEILPNVKTVGILYNTSEDNSLFQLELAKKEAAALGLTLVEGGATAANELPQVTAVLAKKVDVIYAPTDNLVASGMAVITQTAAQSKIPVIGAESKMIEGGAVAAKGFNYYELGKQTARQAVKILKGEIKPAEMPIEYLETLDVAVNKEMAEKLGIELPQSVLDQAK